MEAGNVYGNGGKA